MKILIEKFKQVSKKMNFFDLHHSISMFEVLKNGKEEEKEEIKKELIKILNKYEVKNGK